MRYSGVLVVVIWNGTEMRGIWGPKNNRLMAEKNLLNGKISLEDSLREVENT